MRNEKAYQSSKELSKALRGEDDYAKEIKEMRRLDEIRGEAYGINHKPLKGI